MYISALLCLYRTILQIVIFINVTVCDSLHFSTLSIMRSTCLSSGKGNNEMFYPVLF